MLALALSLACNADDDISLVVDGGPEFGQDDGGERSDVRDDAGLGDGDGAEWSSSCEAGADADVVPPVICSADSWCWENPFPRGGFVNELWTFSPCDAWAVGDGASMLHWDGAVWSPVDVDGVLATTGASVFRVTDLFGLAPDDLWAVATGWDAMAATAVGFVLRWDGAEWTIHSRWSGWNAAVNDLWAAGDGDVWVTRLYDAPLHWDGSSWQSPPVSGGSYSHVWGSASDHVWAVGDRAIRWNGAAWTEMPIEPEGRSLGAYAIGGFDRDDVWLLEDDGINHYDGRSWSRRPWPVPLMSGGSGLWGGSADDLWVACDGGMLHWDGRDWAVPAETSGEELRCVHGSGADDAWAAGGFGRLLHWNGSAWSGYGSAPMNDLEAIDGTSPVDIWAVGYEGTVLHRDATAWTRVDIGTDGWLHGVRALAPDDVWIVGDFGLAMHWDGSAWTTVPTPTTELLTDVWGNDPALVWAVGWQDGSILRWNGTAWSSVARPATDPPPRFDAVWSSGSEDAWAVGGYAIYRWDGTRWSSVDVGILGSWNAVTGSGPDDVWIAGSPLMHWDGTSWQQFSLDRSSIEVGMWAVGPGDVWIVDDSGGILRGGVGFDWPALRSGTNTWLNDVWAPGPDEAWAVGKGGTILHWRP